MQQPAPTPNNQEHVTDQVIGDLKLRKQVGIQRYGVALQPFNGRNPLVDAYEEALDKILYLRQELEERQALLNAVDAVIKAANHGTLMDLIVTISNLEVVRKRIAPKPARPESKSVDGNYTLGE